MKGGIVIPSPVRSEPVEVKGLKDDIKDAEDDDDDASSFLEVATNLRG